MYVKGYKVDRDKIQKLFPDESIEDLWPAVDRELHDRLGPHREQFDTVELCHELSDIAKTCMVFVLDKDEQLAALSSRAMPAFPALKSVDVVMTPGIWAVHGA